MPTLYCICKQPNDSNKPMIGCDFCKNWYHFACLKLDPLKTKAIKKYKCPMCKEKERQLKIQQELEAQRALMALKPVRYKCRLIGCKNMARLNSKYCKDSCGIECTRKILRNIELLHRIQQITKDNENAKLLCNSAIKSVQMNDNWKTILDENNVKPLEGNDLESIDTLDLSKDLLEYIIKDIHDIQSMKVHVEKCDSTIKTLQDKKIALEEFISKIHLLPKDAGVKFVDKEKRSADLVDCVSCGHPIAVKRFSKHLEQCMAKTKNESYMLPRTIIDDTHTVMLCNHFEARTRSYCGRLKANCHLHQEHAKRTKLHNIPICGCPLNEELSEHCKILRAECFKHVGWEKLKLSDIVQQICAQELQKQWQTQEIHALEASLAKKKFISM